MRMCQSFHQQYGSGPLTSGLCRFDSGVLGLLSLPVGVRRPGWQMIMATECLGANPLDSDIKIRAGRCL